MPSITEDDGSLTAPILHDNQPNLQDPTPGYEHDTSDEEECTELCLHDNQPNLRDPTPGYEHDTSDEEKCTELCVSDNRRASGHESGSFGNLLSLVPANHNSMPLGQQQAVNSAVDDFLDFYHLICKMYYQHLLLRAALGITDGISNNGFLRHFFQSNTILKFKRRSRGRKGGMTNPRDLRHGVQRAAFKGFGVRLHHLPQLIHHHFDKQLHPAAVNTLEEGREGVNRSIQTVNSNTYTMNIAAHRQRQRVESVFRLSKIGVDVAHHDQDYDGSIKFTNDDYIFDHEAFQARCEPSRAVVEEVD